jgi:hypothetical protein
MRPTKISASQASPARLPAIAAALCALLACTLIAAPARAASEGPVLKLSSRGVTLPAPLTAHAAKRRHHPAAPAVIRQPRSLYAQPGAYAQFSAAASGFPTPKVHWQVSRDGGASWRNVTGARGSQFTFMAVVAQDGDMFRAIFKNKRGSVATAGATLTVAAGYAAPAIVQQPANETVATGADASFVAAASGDPTPNVQWQLSDNNGESWIDVTGANQPTLSFLASSILAGYEFRAVFSNSLGSVVTSTATLTVTGSNGAPYVTLEPQDEDVSGPGVVSFSAGAAGSPPPSVQWQVSTDSGASWSNIAGATSPTYSFDATAGENLDEYQAVFTNSLGTATTDPAILGVGYLDTTNWAGYIAAGGVYSSVSASWVVPTVTCAAGANTNSSQWVGIDGVSDETVEQDGTYANCNGATPVYGAWYEMLGDDSPAVDYGAQVDLPAGHPVSEGDSITASVTVTGGENWILTIDDTTKPWTYTIPITFAGTQQSSAEWILERPALCDESGDCTLTTLADFGTMTFSNATADAGSGAQSPGALDAAPAQMLRSATNSTLLATPGPLDMVNGNTFSVSWEQGS